MKIYGNFIIFTREKQISKGKSTILRKCEFELIVDNKKELTIKESKLLTALRIMNIANGGTDIENIRTVVEYIMFE